VKGLKIKRLKQSTTCMRVDVISSSVCIYKCTSFVKACTTIHNV